LKKLWRYRNTQMKKLMAMTAVIAMVVMTAGCAERRTGLTSHRIVPPSMVKNWHCKGTLYLLDSGELHCDGKLVAEVEGYTVTK
jgi:hypothetical protein